MDRRQDEAERCAYRYVPAVQAQGLIECVQKRAGHLPGLGRGRAGREHDGDLVAPNARDARWRGKAGGEPGDHDPHGLLSAGETQRLIHPGQPIDRKKRNGKQRSGLDDSEGWA